MNDIVESLDSVENAIANVESAVERVEEAIKDKSSSVQWLLSVAFVMWLVSLAGSIWHAKWRYELQYGLSSDKVNVATTPHDCGFLTAPIGEKYCHYDRVISTVRWATSTKNEPIISYDDGQTWTLFTPNLGETVPQTSTVKELNVSWEKKEDD